MNKLVTGWNVSGNMIAQAGTPLTITDKTAGTAYYGAANPGSAEEAAPHDRNFAPE